MIDKMLGIDTGVDTLEAYTQKLVDNKTLSLGAIEVYSNLYHRLCEAVMNDDEEAIARIREEIEQITK